VGGAILSTDSVELKTITSLLTKLSSCVGNSIPSTSIISLSGYHRLRKITLNLAGRLPTSSEATLIKNATSLAGIELEFDEILDSLMTEAYFYERVKTIFNDKFLLDSNGIEFDFLNFSKNDIFVTQLATKYPAIDIISIRNKYKYGLTQAPLELIAHVVRENRPLTEILTANYAMVNSYTATVFNANTSDPNFNFVLGDLASLHNGTDFREAIITDDRGVLIPHAGILSSLAFLGRYPSSNTNKNRARSRYVYDFFLDIDVEGLASRDALNLNNVDSINAPFNDPQCKACHTTVDPVAGLFKNWRNLGAYRDDNLNWFNGSVPPTMLTPGYGKNSVNPLPPSRSANALQWLAENIVTDNAFAVSMVKIVFKGLTGQNIGKDSDTLELYKTNFVNSGFNLKSLIKEIVNGSYFLASNASENADIKQVAHLGMAKLLTPEQLHHKIKVLTGGYIWTAPKTTSTLLDIETYRILYGGIDSKSVTSRTTDPTVLITGIQQRIANQTACETVATDFNLTTNRIMFPLVDITDTPDTTQGTTRIKENIVYLHKHFLGEVLTFDDVEVKRIFNLFTDIRNLTTGKQLPIDCYNGLAVNNPIVVDSDRTVRPWMAVITYLLSDFNFLYE